MDLSIIITSYNYENFLEESIQSCLRQKTNFKYEIIVVDDGSTDNSQEISSKFSKFCRVYNIENSGVEIAANFGIEKALAPYVLRLDADDAIHENLVEVLLSSIKVNNTAFAYSNYNTVDEKSNIISSMHLPAFNKKEIFMRGDFLASGTILSKDIFKKVSKYNEKKKNCGLENYELILKIISNGYSGNHVNENLFNYRLHSSNMSSNRREAIIEYGKALFNENNYGDYTTNEYHPYGLTF